MKTVQRIQLHRFHDKVAFSTFGEDDSTPTRYLNPDDALAMATELRRFAKNVQDSNDWVSGRIIKGGVAKTESTGQRKVKGMETKPKRWTKPFPKVKGMETKPKRWKRSD